MNNNVNTGKRRRRKRSGNDAAGSDERLQALTEESDRILSLLEGKFHSLSIIFLKIVFFKKKFRESV